LSKLPLKIIERLVNPSICESAREDHEEKFSILLEEKNYIYAQCWIWLHVLALLLPFIQLAFNRSGIMLSSYFKMALRNLKKNIFYAGINIGGLSLALAVGMLLFIYIKNEYSYDTFHKDHENIYRVNTYLTGFTNKVTLLAGASMPLGEYAKSVFPEVDNAVRILVRNEMIKFKNEHYSGGIMLAERSFFDIFHFPLKTGNPEMFFEDKRSIVITDKIAERYFNERNPIGETVSVKLSRQFHDFKITGIIYDIPGNSSIKFNFMIPYDNVSDIYSDNWFNEWDGFSTYTFLKLHSGSNIQGINTKLKELATDKFGKMRESVGLTADGLYYYLKPLKEIHFDRSRFENIGLALGENSADPKYPVILTVIGILILVIASLNYTNLSFALANKRSKEIGMRKVFGARKTQLINQNWGETLVTCFIAALFGVIIAGLGLNKFNILTGKEFSLIYILQDKIIFGGILLITIFTGIISGFYPALIVSRFNPVSALKNQVKVRSFSTIGRSIFITQFALSIFLIICAAVILQQLNFMRSKDPGYNKDQILVVKNNRFGNINKGTTYNNFRNEIIKYADIQAVSGASSVFGDKKSYYGTNLLIEGKSTNSLNMFFIRDDFINTFGLNVLAGNSNTSLLSTEGDYDYIVNEAFLEYTNIGDPLGKIIPDRWDGNHKLIAILKDFHYESLHMNIEPLIFIPVNNNDHDASTNYIFIKFKPNNISDLLFFLEQKWKEVNPNLPFEYTFFDEDFAAQYKEDEKWSGIIGYAAALANIIALLGLVGITAFIISNSTKEIGIRKVLGSTTFNIIKMFDVQFAKMISLSIAIAFPAAYFFLNKWLESFAYRIEIPILEFILSAITIMSVVIITVSLQSLKAASTDPVNVLRDN